MTALDMPTFREVGVHPAIWFLTNRMTLLATPEDTSYAYSLVHTVTQCNGTPPPHIHTREDEVFYMLRGHAKLLVKDRVYEAHPGSLTFFPRGLAHSPIILSEDAEVLQLITPGEFVDFFRRQSIPATSPGVPTIVQAHMPMMDEILDVGREFGVRFLPPGAAVSSWPYPEGCAEPKHLAAGEGEVVEYAGSRITTKLAGADTRGIFSVFEIEDTPGQSQAVEIPSTALMGFYMIEGEYDFRVGDRVQRLQAGGFAHVPEHQSVRYQFVDGAKGRILAITNKSRLQDVFPA